MIGVNASRISQEYPEDEMVLVQGIIDAYFEEDGKIILVDYKSDYVKNPVGTGPFIFGGVTGEEILTLTRNETYLYLSQWLRH